MKSNISGSSSKHEPVGGLSTSTQLQVLALLRSFVGLLVSDATIDISNLQEFHVIIRWFCEECPDAAQALATTILAVRDSVQKALHQDQDTNEKDTTRVGKCATRKPVSSKAVSYRSLKAAKAKRIGSSSEGMSDSIDAWADTSVGDVAAHGAQSLGRNVNAVVLQDQKAGPNLEASSEVVSVSRLETLSQPGQQRWIAQEDSVPDDAVPRPGTPDETCKDTIGATETTPPAGNKVENKQASVLPRSPAPLVITDLVVVAPSADGASASPQREEIHRDVMPSPLESISLTPMSVPGSSSPETSSLLDLVIEAVRVIHQFSKYPYAVPAEVHSRILRTHQNNSQEATARLNRDGGWSDGSMWMRILEMGSTHKQKVTILNMVEYIGAWEWYDEQVNLAKTTIHTKKGKLVDRRGAATHVLKAMGSVQRGDSLPGRWISGVGTVAVGGEEDRTDPNPENDEGGISAQDRRLQRKRISLQLSRGQKLSTKLVQNLGLGILFSPKVWEYTKMHGEQLDRLIRDIQADERRMTLLRILGPQLEQLVCKGRPDLHALYDGLCQERLVSQREMQDLRETFALDSDPIPKGSLDMAVQMLLRDVRTKILGKRKLEGIDAVVVNQVPVVCSTFDRLRYGKWLNDEIINLAMSISDKPDSVVYGYSVPLDADRKSRTTRPSGRPLAAWGQRVNRLREKSRNAFGKAISLVYYCPLNHRNAHFTLLEINDQERSIRHYDSAVSQATTDGNLESTRVSRLVQEEFAELKYKYSEAPTPQQADDWSCGIRVVWNFRRLSNGLPIGGWDTVKDPERMKMELVEGLFACVEASAMSRYTDEPNESLSDMERSQSKKPRSSSHQDVPDEQ